MVSITTMIDRSVRAVIEKRPDGAASKDPGADVAGVSVGREAPKAAAQVAHATEAAPGVSKPGAGAAERRAAGAWDKPALFALVRENTTRAKALGVIERAAADLSDLSRRNYERLAAKRLDVQKDGGGLGLGGVSRASFYPVRAAIIHQASLAAAEARSECDKAQRSGDLEGAAEAALRAARAMDAIDAALSAEKPENRAKRQTKRNDLPKDISEVLTWQELIWSQATPAPRPALALMWAAGLRPAEIEAGVDVVRTTHPVTGEAMIVITVPGKKVTRVNGQPRRRLLVDADHPAGQALMSVMGDRQQMLIQRRASTIKDDMKALKGKTGLPVSAYSFRHQFSSNAKASDMPPEMVAAALGHASVRTQGRYGLVGQAQKGGGAVLDAKGTRQVRDRAPTVGPPKSPPENAVKPAPRG